MQLCSFCKTSSCDLVVDVRGQLFLFILFPWNKLQHQLQESQVTCHCELPSKDQLSWDKLTAYTLGVCCRMYSMVLCAETCYINLSQALEGEFGCLSFWQIVELSTTEWFSLFPSWKWASWNCARFDPKTHKHQSTLLLSEVAFCSKHVWIKTDKNSC